MGGGTFVDGVRRLFQRRSASVANNISSNDEQQHQPHAVLREQPTLSIVEDFDISGLKLIQVPKRIDFPLPNSSMDSHKKVPFLLLHGFPSLRICLCFIWTHVMWCVFGSLIDCFLVLWIVWSRQLGVGFFSLSLFFIFWFHRFCFMDDYWPIFIEGWEFVDLAVEVNGDFKFGAFCILLWCWGAK